MTDTQTNSKNSLQDTENTSNLNLTHLQSLQVLICFLILLWVLVMCYSATDAWMADNGVPKELRVTILFPIWILVCASMVALNRKRLPTFVAKIVYAIRNLDLLVLKLIDKFLR